MGLFNPLTPREKADCLALFVAGILTFALPGAMKLVLGALCVYFIIRITDFKKIFKT